MFQWLVNAIAQPFLWVGKTLISFVGNLLKGFVYDIFIMTILKLINFLELIFSFLSVKGPSLFLFNMKSVDGRTILQNNFFTHPSPLQKFYIAIVAIAGVVGVVLIMLGVAKHISAKKGGGAVLIPVRNYVAGTFSFVLIPVTTIFLLSGVGAITQVFSGTAPNPPSISDIRTYQSKLPTLISRVKYAKNNFNGDIQEIYAYGLDKNTGDVLIKHGLPSSFGDYDSPNFIPAGKASTIRGRKYLQYQSMFNNGGIMPKAKVGDNPNNVPLDPAMARNTTPISPLNEVPIGKTTKVFSYLQNMMAYAANISNSIVNNQNTNMNNIPKTNSIENSNTLIMALQNLNGSYNDLFTKQDKKDIAVFGTTINQYSKEFDDVLNNANEIINLARDQKDNAKAISLRSDINKLTRAQEKLSNYKIAFEDYKYKFEELKIKDVILANTDMSTIENQKLWNQANHLLNISNIYDSYIKPSFAIKNGIANITIPKTLGDITFIINELLVGSKNVTSKNGVPISLPSLKQQLSTEQDSSIAITIYQIASGKTDINWDSTPANSDLNWGNMLLALFAGGFTILFLVKLVIYAALRIFEIGVLFLSGPFFIASSASDNGERTKSWMRLFAAKILSIIAVVIAFSMIVIAVKGVDGIWKLSEGQKIVNAARNFSLFGISSPNASEWLGKNLLKLIIIIAGLIAAQKGGILIASAFGTNAGIAESMGHFRTLGSLGRGAKGMISATGSAGRSIGRGSAGIYRGIRDNSGLTHSSRENYANKARFIKEKIALSKAKKDSIRTSIADKRLSKGKNVSGRHLRSVNNHFRNNKSQEAEEIRRHREQNYHERNIRRERKRSEKLYKKDGK